jgi:predicted transposase YbfD/YdcC
VKQSGNFLLVQVKGNQPTLLDTLRSIAETEHPLDHHETVDRHHHGRQEHRKVETFAVDNRLGADWNGLILSLGRITRLTWHKDTKSGFWHQTEEVSFYACQTVLNAKRFGQAVRAHWAIENRNHYVRDVTLMEDASRIRTKPGHFARFRSIALNIMRANGVTNVARELYVNALNLGNAIGYPVS